MAILITAGGSSIADLVDALFKAERAVFACGADGLSAIATRFTLPAGLTCEGDLAAPLTLAVFGFHRGGSQRV